MEDVEKRKRFKVTRMVREFDLDCERCGREGYERSIAFWVTGWTQPLCESCMKEVATYRR